MKKFSMMIFAAATTLALATMSLAGAVPNTGSTSSADPKTIAQLQVAAQQALQEGRNGNKNNAEFLRKNYEINQLVDRLQNGEKVDPSEIDKAMEPAHVW